MPKALCAVTLLALPFVLPAETNPASSWSSLSSLKAGQRIQVTDTSSKKHSGDFESVSDTGIVLRTSTGEESIPSENVREVTLPGKSHRGRDALIWGGGAAGAGAGIGVALCAGGNGLAVNSNHEGKCAAVGAVMGGVPLAAVGALVPSHSNAITVYKLDSH